MRKETTAEMLAAKANDGAVSKSVGWEGNFNDMALKTVIRRLLSKYGYLSIEMSKAISEDAEPQGASEGEPQTIDLDNTQYEEVDTSTGEVKKDAPKAEKEAEKAPDMPEY